MNAAELNQMARLAREAKLSVLADSCLDAFSNLRSMSSNLTTPVPLKQRVSNVRVSNIGSLTSSFHNIEHMDLGVSKISPALQAHTNYFCHDR